MITIPTALNVLSTEFSSHHSFVFLLNKGIHRHVCKTLYSLQIRKNAEREKPIFRTIFPNGEFAIMKSNLFNIGMIQQKIPQLYLHREIFVWSCPGEAHSAPLHKSWQENAFDMKFDTVILCKVTKKMIEKKFKIAAIRIMTSLIISIFLKNYAKNG